MGNLANAPIIGLHCKAYVGPCGLSLPQLVRPQNEMRYLRTANVNLTTSTADVTTRGSDWRLSIPTLKEATIEGEILIIRNSRDSEMFMNAWLTNTPVAMFISNGFGEGLFGDFSISSMSQNQPLEEAIIANYSVSPTLTDRFPKWVKTTFGIGPIITSPAEFVGKPKKALTFTLTASPAATRWQAEGLPDGLSIDAATGAITGTVADEGVWWPYVTASNVAGSTTRALQIVIEA